MIGIGLNVWLSIFGSHSAPDPNSYLLLTDGSSFLLLVDGSSRLILVG